MAAEQTTDLEPDCGRCFNSGWIVIRAPTLAYVGPGPLSEEVSGLTERRCKDCDRAIVIQKMAEEYEREC